MVKREVKGMRQLPIFKGYTVDERLREFRRVDREKLTIEFVPFASRTGQRLLQEMRLEGDGTP
jgi:hypothetical protein